VLPATTTTLNDGILYNDSNRHSKKTLAETVNNVTSIILTLETVCGQTLGGASKRRRAKQARLSLSTRKRKQLYKNKYKAEGVFSNQSYADAQPLTFVLSSLLRSQRINTPSSVNTPKKKLKKGTKHPLSKTNLFPHIRITSTTPIPHPRTKDPSGLVVIVVVVEGCLAAGDLEAIEVAAGNLLPVGARVADLVLAAGVGVEADAARGEGGAVPVELPAGLVGDLGAALVARAVLDTAGVGEGPAGLSGGGEGEDGEELHFDGWWRWWWWLLKSVEVCGLPEAGVWAGVVVMKAC
jgi:hypothetical protein